MKYLEHWWGIQATYPQPVTWIRAHHGLARAPGFLGEIVVSMGDAENLPANRVKPANDSHYD